MVQKPIPVSPGAGQGVQGSVRAAAERLERDSPCPSYLRPGTVLRGSVGPWERVTTAHCVGWNLEWTLHLSCAFLVDVLPEMGGKTNQIYVWRSMRRLMLCVTCWRGGCASAYIVPPNVTTVFGPGNQLWDLEFEQWGWVWVCYTQSMGCLVFLSVFSFIKL